MPLEDRILATGTCFMTLCEIGSSCVLPGGARQRRTRVGPGLGHSRLDPCRPATRKAGMDLALSLPGPGSFHLVCPGV